MFKDKGTSHFLPMQVFPAPLSARLGSHCFQERNKLKNNAASLLDKLVGRPLASPESDKEKPGLKIISSPSRRIYTGSELR